MKSLDNKRILVTGGTGSFGKTFVRATLENAAPGEIVVLSRDESKQHDMRIEFDDDRIRFVIGDVRDAGSVSTAMKGIDYVFHAAALKHVPSCEFFPIEAVKTNVLGSENVIRQAEAHGIRKIVLLSTDKAVSPLNAMGMSKALMEKLASAVARDPNHACEVATVRYGNVMYSRGSVIPLFVRQALAGDPITVTDPTMTRFMMSLAESVSLVNFAFTEADSGDTLVRKAPATTTDTLAQAVRELLGSKSEIREVGIREGEKKHETLVNAEEMAYAQDRGDFIAIKGSREQKYEPFLETGHEMSDSGAYTSENTERLDIEGTKDLLRRLPEFEEILGRK